MPRLGAQIGWDPTGVDMAAYCFQDNRRSLWVAGLRARRNAPGSGPSGRSLRRLDTRRQSQHSNEHRGTPVLEKPEIVETPPHPPGNDAPSPTGRRANVGRTVLFDRQGDHHSVPMTTQSHHRRLSVEQRRRNERHSISMNRNAGGRSRAGFRLSSVDELPVGEGGF